MTATATAAADPVVGVPEPAVRRRRGWLLPAGLFVLLVVPVAAGLLAAREPTWYPVYDLAMTELRVRDVGTADTPLVGLPGRIESEGEQGSHPGPLSFYLLAPAHRLLGGSSFALLASNALLQVAAMGTALALAWSRARPGLAVAVAVLLAVLLQGFGLETLLEPWNPWIPRLWFLVTALAAWRVVGGDLRALPVVVVAGSLCVQTHVPYAAVTLAAGTLALGAAVVHAVRRRHAGADRRRAWTWLAVAAGLGVLLWAPPLVDQVARDPGNLAILADHFAGPEDEVNGARQGVEQALRRLDLHHLVVQQWRHPGTLGEMLGAPPPRPGFGVAALVVWLASVAVALRLRHRPLLALHAVVGTTLVAAAFAMGRIFGPEWYYLMIWGWVVGGLLAVAVGWTAAAAIVRSLDARRRESAARVLAVLGVVVAATFAGRVLVTAPDVAMHGPDLNVQLGAVVPPTVAALHARAADDGPYLVSWTDVVHGGSGGYALVNELDRHGFPVGVEPVHGVTMGPHRVIDPERASLRVHLATGVLIDEWRRLPGAEVVAYHDPRTADERAEYERLRARVAADLEAEGLSHLLPALERDLFGTSMNNRLPGMTSLTLGRMLELGAPAAVILVPAGVTP